MRHKHKKKRVRVPDLAAPAAIVIRDVIGAENGGRKPKVRGRPPNQFVRATDQRIAELGRDLRKPRSK